MAPGLCADPDGLVWRKTPALTGEGDPGRKQALGCRTQADVFGCLTVTEEKYSSL